MALSGDVTSSLWLRYKGIAMVIVAASLWGLSGTVAQFLFQQEGLDVNWLVTVRLLVSGVLLLLFAAWRGAGASIWSVWCDRTTRVRLILFGVAGMLGVQYTYFAAIEAGNAAMATLLQYLGPLFVFVYVALRLFKLPSRTECMALILALLGIFLLVTNGKVGQLTVPGSAVAWGLASAIALAFYTLYPAQLLERFGSAVTVGWGMVIGGVGIGLVNPVWQVSVEHWSLITVGMILFVIFFGTLLPFFLYLDSLRFIKPTETSLVACAEPLAAAISSIIWLKVSFGPLQAVGGLFIMVTVFLLSARTDGEVQTDGLNA
ncbi:DMT family transporter [Caldalkalibacillus thermarum]|uniref:DMT family transporter n=1 Tax=Caldalkalibacillus thermarum TaxID=296745 RepID=UPI001E33C71B|nr:EamA family transporter [Caldalkalibacillus thermarum]